MMKGMRKEFSTGVRRNLALTMAVSLLAIAGTQLDAVAQFNSGTANGGTVAVQPNPTTGAANPNSPAVYQGANMNAGLINTGKEGSTLGYQDIRQIHTWGRAIYHSDGSFTESTKPKALNSMIQETKSPNGVLLFKRVISLDSYGRPEEVLIYDGRGLFRFRGEIVYDNQGRFREEVIFDAKNQLIRRRIQEYQPNGQAGGLKIVDDLSKVPADLKLVITRQDGYDAEVAQRNQQEFWDNANVRERGSSQQPQSGSGASATEPKEEKKRGGLFRIFGREKD